MEYGRLIRITKGGGGVSSAAAYIVAVTHADEALSLIERLADPGDKIEVLGRVSGALLKAMQLQPGDYVRTDEYQARQRRYG